ncbi:UDP-N-acetylmuramoyl-L-alanine--D-glutamate ligase [Rickettsiales endosymbiont of Stachyamoeba lipophora]|uniref:UDP-N-acetylmuramoyl-L-alanine--D-glutamate ligase n=1 Tax=Rickettsiales endosymbiont of Stachyamoeba lipophora TaxID=2486578 RepID=UPI0013DE10E0|nr:UDP-N-acetylmuramoyl-L-alanine--D-glutamate ligase [Rickettsiales endosymbiont of Stachyamoeba lipophora]
MNHQFHNKTYYIIGLGKSGLASYNFLKPFAKQIYVWDDKNIPEILQDYACSPDAILPKTILNQVDDFEGEPVKESKKYTHKGEDCKNHLGHLTKRSGVSWQEIDYVLVSPGIPTLFPKPHRATELAVNNNIPIISDLELLFAFASNAQFIGITGTNGKSTTTSLIYHILKENGLKVALGGNIGIPVLELPINNSSDFIYVLELSSYQLELLKEYHLNLAILLNITKDHIERHGNMENYIQAKCKIFEGQNASDLQIVSMDSPILKEIIGGLQLSSKAQLTQISTETILEHGINFKDNNLFINHDKITDIEFKHLPGRHNKENIAAAVAATLFMGLELTKILESIKSFKPLKHRFEYITTVNNVEYYNDSKATNAEAAMAAITSFDQIYWILGGVPKEGGIDILIPYFKCIKKAYLIGEAKEEFARTLVEHKVEYVINGTLDKALLNAKKDAEMEEGIKRVVFSPACASFDQFKNFEHRGEEFIKIIYKWLDN